MHLLQRGDWTIGAPFRGIPEVSERYRLQCGRVLADHLWIDGVITVWNTNTYQRLKSLPHEEQGTGDDTKRTIVGIATAPEADLYAVGFMKGSLGIHDGNFDQPIVSFVAHRDVIMGLAISSCDNSICDSVSRPDREGCCDVQTHARVSSSPKSEHMITGSKRRIRMWNAHKCRV